MDNPTENLVPKVHPATRQVEPDDPMNLHGFELPGDPNIMLRMLVEEYARMGWGLEQLMTLFRDPFYHAAHGLWLRYGEREMRDRLTAMLARTGVIRVRSETAPAAEELVNITLPSNR